MFPFESTNHLALPPKGILVRLISRAFLEGCLMRIVLPPLFYTHGSILHTVFGALHSSLNCIMNPVPNLNIKSLLRVYSCVASVIFLFTLNICRNISVSKNYIIILNGFIVSPCLGIPWFNRSLITIRLECFYFFTTENGVFSAHRIIFLGKFLEVELLSQRVWEILKLLKHTANCSPKRLYQFPLVLYKNVCFPASLPTRGIVIFWNLGHFGR